MRLPAGQATAAHQTAKPDQLGFVIFDCRFLIAPTHGNQLKVGNRQLEIANQQSQSTDRFLDTI